jgi:hypothetical protein
LIEGILSGKRHTGRVVHGPLGNIIRSRPLLSRDLDNTHSCRKRDGEDEILHNWSTGQDFLPSGHDEPDGDFYARKKASFLEGVSLTNSPNIP